MTKKQKKLIQSLLSEAYTREKQRLETLRKNDDNMLAESIYLKRMKLIEEIFKEVEKL